MSGDVHVRFCERLGGRFPGATRLIITGKDVATLQKARVAVEVFLRQRGLTLSNEKTKITHIADGFDFLGWNFRKYKGKFLCKPAKGNVKTYLTKIRDTVKKLQTVKQSDLSRVLNPIIKGWSNYHKNQTAKVTFDKTDREIWKALWRGCKRRHPHKPWTWIKKKYFIRENGQRWIFGYRDKGENINLIKAKDTPIVRHVKIKAEANPYDPAWEEYFEKRQFQLMKKDLRSKKLSSLFVRQKGRCAQCHQPIIQETGWDIHHIVPKVEGGKDTLGNLSLLHPNCHRQHHSLKAAGS